MTPRRLFRLFAIAEAVTWALLLTGMALKYGAGVGDWPVSVAGPIHGFVFIAYAITVGLVAVNQRWRVGTTVLAGASAIIPFASIPVEIGFDSRRLLAGGWRREASGDSRDRRPLERALRWCLARPVTAAVVLALAAAVIFSALLMVGPPGGTA